MLPSPSAMIEPRWDVHSRRRWTLTPVKRPAPRLSITRRSRPPLLPALPRAPLPEHSSRVTPKAPHQSAYSCGTGSPRHPSAAAEQGPRGVERSSASSVAMCPVCISYVRSSPVGAMTSQHKPCITHLKCHPPLCDAHFTRKRGLSLLAVLSASGEQEPRAIERNRMSNRIHLYF